ncbi:hypothetical protein RCL1_006605 [Eukaryota sp. TZLM3-RCL]
MPALYIECDPALRPEADELLKQLRRTYPGRVSVRWNIDYNEDDITPRSGIFSVLWEFVREVLIETQNRVPSLEEMKTVLEPLIHPEDNRIKCGAGHG